MHSGVQDEAVIDCVNRVLINHGWSAPIDPNGTMGGYYKYKEPLMIAFHNQVAISLASKGYDYEYPHNSSYMRQTLAMTLLALYGIIDSQTKAGPRHLDRIAANIQNLQSALAPVPSASDSGLTKDGKPPSKKTRPPAVKKAKTRRPKPSTG